MNSYKLKFPIGEYESNKNPTTELLNTWIEEIERFPIQLEQLTKDVSTEKLQWKYRPGSWTIKQVIHHCADSHMNSLIRFKLALTEDTPVIRPYFEDRWAELVDSQDIDIQYSLFILKGLHHRWVVILKNLHKEQLQLEYTHPEHGKKINLAETIGMYAWHCRHHLAHIKQALESGGKYK